MAHIQKNGFGNVVIEPARAEDALDIVAVHSLAWMDRFPSREYGITGEDIAEKVALWNRPEAVARLAQGIETPKEGTLHFVARAGKMVVGHYRASKEEPRSRLETLSVLPDYQGKSIGFRLVMHVIEQLGHEKDIELEVVQYNQKAIKLYESVGFAITGIAHNPASVLPSGKVLPEYQMIKKAR